jgi:hypothetical protein
MFESGRLYHPTSLGNYGLVRSKIADELYRFFEFNSDGQPAHFNWEGRRLQLTNELLKYDGAK